jgi:hypothetical protein
MKTKILTLLMFLIVVLTIISCKKDNDGTDPIVVGPGNAGLLIINHENTNLVSIPENWIDSAKAKLHIFYAHTSHGSQLTSGMTGLEAWKGSLYAWNDGGAGGALDLDDHYADLGDLGSGGYTGWATTTRTYLENSENSDVNVVIWSWCGGVSVNTEEDINTYLNTMSQLEADYPNISFIYMTGHLDGTGEEGNLHLRNEQIRKFCTDHKKILYDFADIESYDPDGNYYLDKMANDGCEYDSDGNGSRDANWAIEWQNSHNENVEWYSCGSAHSQPLNANMKAYAAWWLWARLSGWSGQ